MEGKNTSPTLRLLVAAFAASALLSDARGTSVAPLGAGAVAVLDADYGERLARQLLSQPIPATKAPISYTDARSVLEAFRESLPPELKGKSSSELEAGWPAWVSRHDRDIRARVERGDEDSLVNLWLFGTTFTKQPRATQLDAVELLDRRLEDLLSGVASPGTNERLLFAREVVERQGFDPAMPRGKDQTRRYLIESLGRVRAEFETKDRKVALELAAAGDRPDDVLRVLATAFENRGLSSDTSILVDFAVERALEAAKAEGILKAGSVRQVALIGPGLDFINKADGYDFYPQQTIQPFAVIDSLIRLGLARLDDLRLATFDLSQRVNHHLESARERARGGNAYVLYLPLAFSADEHWDPGLVAYWERLGDRIDEKTAAPLPTGAVGIWVRAVRVRPAVLGSITPEDLNIVLERRQLAADQRFDLVIATNVLVYYDTFEQALAVTNIAPMLRPGGMLLSNTVFPGTGLFRLSGSPLRVAYSDRQGDHMVWYQIAVY